MVGKKNIRYVESQANSTQEACHGSNNTPPLCPLCHRPLLAGPSVDEHHLVPKSKGGKDKFLMHKICHQKIHSLIDEATLAKQYCTWDALRSHPEIQKFIAWVAKRPPEYLDKNRRPAKS
ncbi:MAG: HNH endonuclease [Limnobacter sp.]|nr:HNH endonuclease [Limnobacter sp.]